MKIVFMGTPDFAVGALQAIIDAGHEVVAVVTQPDKPKGRGKEVQYTPVKECAMKASIPVFQPDKIKTPDSVSKLQEFGGELFIVAAFGQILSQEILDMPTYGCINIHASLLPKYRGAAPIQWAIIDGERETGVTIMQMDAGLDTGNMLLKKVVPITENDTGESLHDKLMEAGALLVVEAIPMIEAGILTPEKQRDEDSCYAKMLTKSLGKIDWSKSAIEIARLIRGLNSWPSAYTIYHGKTLKIWQAQCDDIGTLEDVKPGSIFKVEKNSVLVNTGNGALRILEVQMQGKKRMSVHDFLLGNQVVEMEQLGEEN